MLTVLHSSDLQVGKPYRPPAAEALVRFVDESPPDVIVVAGDLTQRAKASEYRIARALIARFGQIPVVVTPGNHDIPVYRFWERALFPYRNWKRFIASEVDSVLRVPGATFVALNSAAPWTALVGGRLSKAQEEYAGRAFEDSDPDDARILVVHHHFVVTDDGSGGNPLPGARSHLEAFGGMGIDLVLGGHVHQTRVLLPGDPRTDAPFAMVSAGTTTSRRGRGPEADLNTLNLVQIDDETIRIVPHRLWDERGRFEPMDPVVIPRAGAGDGAGDSETRSAEGSRGGA
jgi:3',5'-cyclic AMP phosphodiesterase CpdA